MRKWPNEQRYYSYSLVRIEYIILVGVTGWEEVGRLYEHFVLRLRYHSDEFTPYLYCLFFPFLVEKFGWGRQGSCLLGLTGNGDGVSK